MKNLGGVICCKNLVQGRDDLQDVDDILDLIKKRECNGKIWPVKLLDPGEVSRVVSTYVLSGS